MPVSEGVLCFGWVRSSAVMLLMGGDLGEGGKLQSSFCTSMKGRSEVEKVRLK